MPSTCYSKTGEEHIPGTTRKNTGVSLFFSEFFLDFFSHSMTYCAATAAPKSKTLSCQYCEREREQLQRRSYVYHNSSSTEVCSSTNWGLTSIWSYHPINPPHMPHMTGAKRSSREELLTGPDRKQTKARIRGKGKISRETGKEVFDDDAECG
ncbi:hypothetical protein BGY98DRAFT_35350 [Russula aff. rugulosa BPL654]|nr:hypothetical protein BGY98DRAFT_35350 [Russula aff. rugulosa BPL654]